MGRAPVAPEQIAEKAHVVERSGWDGHNVAACADEAKNVANVEIEAAICNLEACVVSAR